MSEGVNSSVNNVRFENEGILEKFLGGWQDELKNIPLLVALNIIILFGPSLLLLGFLWLPGGEEGAVIENTVPPFFVTFVLVILILDPIFSLLTPLILVYDIYVVVNLLKARSDHRRYYIVFKLLSSSDKESVFSLSSLNSLLLSSFFIEKYKVQRESLLEEAWQTPFSSTINKIQLSKLKIKSDKPFLFLLPFMYPFLIASQGGKNVNNTFIFYSRHQSCWDKVQLHLSGYNLGIEILHSEEMRS